jgi:citrate lyase subunit beta / citryl-CoA lyase
MDRSYLFVPGHNEKLLSKVFGAGADAVILDLEDAVPPDHKVAARGLVAEVLVDHPAWVRVNSARTAWCEADLQTVAARAYGIRIPKTESAEDVAWVAQRAPGKPIICAIENAHGVLAAHQIACAPGVQHLAMGGVDMQRDLHASNGNLQTLHVRSHLVVASRAAGIERPIDSVYPRLEDDAGLREQTRFAHSLGFFGKSAIHPRQLPILHEVFTPSEDDLAWAHGVVAAFDAAGGAALRLPSGEFVDLPVAERARRVLDLAASLSAETGPSSGAHASLSPRASA